MKIKSKRNLSKLTKIFLVATLTVYFCTMFVKQEIKIVHLKNDKKAVETKTQVALQEKKEIDEQLEKENYNRIVEEIARDKLGFLKANEILFVDSAEK